jgi:hypothetical protein
MGVNYSHDKETQQRPLMIVAFAGGERLLAGSSIHIANCE